MRVKHSFTTIHICNEANEKMQQSFDFSLHIYINSYKFNCSKLIGTDLKKNTHDF